MTRSAAALDITAPSARTGAEVICDALLAHGVKVLFGYCGGAILEFYDALHRTPGLYHVTVRHEQAAAHAATAYARVTGQAGVCVATSGPGVTNLITGIMDAHMDSAPLIILGGQVATPLIGRDAFQEADVMAMTAAITKHSFQPRHVDELAGMIEAAFHIATTGRPGPVYIDLPKDVLSARTSDGAPASWPLPGYQPGIAPDAAAIRRAAQLLRDAERPVMLLGGGAIDAGIPLRQLAERFQLPVVSTINAKGVIPDSHPQALGIIGMYGRKSGIWALSHADVVLAFGCRFTDRITGQASAFAAGKRIVHVDIDAYELGKNVPAAIAIQADVADAATALLSSTLDHQATAPQRAWARQLHTARAICERCVPHTAASGVHPKLVMDALNRVRRPHDIVTTGVGQHQMFASHFLAHEQPRTFITSAGAGTMGYGLPAAIGAAMAKPDARVFVVEGDGSFQMTSQELATAAQERLPIVMLILDNQQLGMVRQWQDRVYDGRHAAVRFDQRPGHPDFVALARAYGVPAIAVTELGALAQALDDAVRCDGPTLIHVAVDGAVDNYPMMPAGSDFAQFHGNCVPHPGELYTAGDTQLIQEARVRSQTVAE